MILNTDLTGSSPQQPGAGSGRPPVLRSVDRQVGGRAELVPPHVLELLVLLAEPENIYTIRFAIMNTICFGQKSPFHTVLIFVTKQKIRNTLKKNRKN